MGRKKKKRKKILALTGIRSDYDILFPVLNELTNRDFELSIAISGAHLSDRHGFTLDKVENDGFKIADKIDSLLSTDRDTQRSKGVGLLTTGLSQTVERICPDFITVVGDREESIAAAIVANYSNTLLIHLAGGDPVYGNSDDPIRFSVSKMAHLHCVYHEEYAQNLINMGEQEFRVFNTGNPAYVNIDHVENMQVDDLFREIKIDYHQRKYIVFIQHPLSSELSLVENQIQTSLESLREFSRKHDYITIGISPNSDPGSEIIRNKFKEYANDNWFFPLETLSRKRFVNLMRNAKALAGNSSMGILEAPHYKIPVINIGNRQKGRINAGNVTFVEHNQNAIISELERACLNSEYRESIRKIINPYGDGTSAKKVVDAISSVDLKNDEWYIKRLVS